MNIEKFKQAVVTKVYHIPADRKVPLHQHAKHDEVFYCIRGEGFGVLADREVELRPGQAFIVRAGTMHALRTDGDLYVTSMLIPLADDAAYAE
jgi:mannose-6-phosphate isomerase-like protein (cupin superfamily)